MKLRARAAAVNLWMSPADRRAPTAYNMGSLNGMQENLTWSLRVERGIMKPRLTASV